MKKILSTLALIAAPLIMFAQGIKFEHISLEEALAKAKAENKMLFIDGYAVWCGPCKKMANTVFKEEKVGKYFDEHFIALKVDVERGEGPAIKSKYGIKSLPTYVYLDSDGIVVYRSGSAMPTEEFLEMSAKAVEFGNGANSVGRIAEQYEEKKNDEQFLKAYLAKLKESESIGYADVVEQYLSIQKSMDEGSKEMVQTLAEHANELIMGGIADDIIQRNFGSDQWKLWVRKDIRQTFMDLPKKMLQTTTQYAISHKDTVKLEYCFSRAGEIGAKTDAAARKRMYVNYYLQTGEGEKYKALVRDDNEAFVKSVDVEELRRVYLENQRLRAEGDAEALRLRPYAVRTSQNIYMMVSQYAKFANCEQDNEDVLRWMEVAYDLMPGDPEVMSQYASVLYMYGNNDKEALQIKEEAYAKALAEETPHIETIKIELENMREGKKDFNLN